MFDLNQAVNEWCNKVVAYDISHADRIDELKDHMYCLIEAQVNAGKSEKRHLSMLPERWGIPLLALVIIQCMPASFRECVGFS